MINKGFCVGLLTCGCGIFFSLYWIKRCHHVVDLYRSTTDAIVSCSSNIVFGVAIGESMGRDAWGREFQISTNKIKKVIVISSAGNDGMFGTDDDVTSRIELVSQDNYTLITTWRYGFDSGGQIDACCTAISR